MPETANETMVIARLNARVQPVDRGDYFEDPLDDALREAGIGEVTGGGTQLAEEPDGIEFCELEIMVADPSEETLGKITQTLEDLGAPKGSLLQMEGKPDRSFGTHEGFGIFLNGTDLPDEVYANTDVNDVIEKLEACMGDGGAFRGYWQGSQETALYFYGESFEHMKSATADYVAKTPLCERSRIVQIA